MPVHARATKTAGPAARGVWRQIELRVGRVNTRAGLARLLGKERMPSGPGPWFVFLEMKVDEDGRVTNTVARDYRSGELLWYSGEESAEWHASLFADAYAAQEPRNPHPVRVLNLSGRCIHAVRGASSGQGFREIPCEDASAIAVRRMREHARATRNAPRVTPRVPVAPEKWWKEGATPGGRGATGWPMFDFKVVPRRIYGGTQQWAVFRARTWEESSPEIDRMTEWDPDESRVWETARDMAQGVSEAEARANPRNPHPVRLLEALGGCVMAFRAGARVPCP